MNERIRVDALNARVEAQRRFKAWLRSPEGRKALRESRWSVERRAWWVAVGEVVLTIALTLALGAALVALAVW